MLQEIKTKYANKCFKCNREIKAGWKAFFDANTVPKRLYCKPCGEQLSKIAPESQEKQSLPDETELLLSELTGQLKLNSDLMVQIDERIRDIEKQIDFITGYLKSKSKPEEKKSK